MVMRRLFLLPGRVTAALLFGGWKFIATLLWSVSVSLLLLLKPRLFFLWLGRSYYAHLFSLLLFLGLYVLFPESPIYLAELTARLTASGISEAARVERGLRLYLPLGACILALSAFWLSIPSALRRAERLSATSETEADFLADVSPYASARLYRKAIALTIKPKRLTALREKLRAVSDNGTQGAADRTVVMQAQGAPSGNEQRYMPLRELGRGTMGVVLLARDNVLEREVAIKELPPGVAGDRELFERFKREAKAQAGLNHPGIAQVYDFAEFDGRTCIVMEYVDGEELKEVVKAKGRLEPAEVLRIASKMAEALDFTHEKGILHRDLKPANVIMDPLGQPKIMDFGVARLAMSAAHTLPGTIMGSPAFMSPEQARGEKVDVQADIYSLGALMYNLLTGKNLFEGSVEEVIAQVLQKKPVPVRKIEKKTPLKLARLVMSMLEKSPKERPASMAEVVTALGQIKIRA